MGIGNLMKAFAQNSSNIFDWLVKMTAKFREWSEQVGKSEGFKKFVQYVQENGPVIMDLIGNIVRVLVAFGTAMAPIASVILKVVTALAGFIAVVRNTPCYSSNGWYRYDTWWYVVGFTSTNHCSKYHVI